MTHSGALAAFTLVALTGFGASATALAQASAACSARSARTVTPVVELYTSEGCSSCPPADRWLSRLKADPQVVALAFHVDYWDRLGWKDRFASAAFTQRQAEHQASSGARFSYTPQVVIDGIDRKDWLGSPALAPAPSRALSPLELTLSRRGDRVSATVVASAAAPRRLGAYWAVTEDGHVTAVKAGENDGATLHHDFVVREYRPVAPWSASPRAPQTLVFDSASVADAVHPRQINLVVVDAETGRPLQALKIGC